MLLRSLPFLSDILHQSLKLPIRSFVFSHIFTLFNLFFSLPLILPVIYTFPFRLYYFISPFIFLAFVFFLLSTLSVASYDLNTIISRESRTPSLTYIDSTFWHLQVTFFFFLVDIVFAFFITSFFSPLPHVDGIPVCRKRIHLS